MPFEADREVPGLILKFGDYPLYYGGVGATRSLGRLGVPMYAITEDRCTPAAASRYLKKAFVWPTTGAEGPGRIVEGLLRIGRAIGRPTVLVPTAEEAAVLIAEHRDALGARFLVPRVERGLPRRLASVSSVPGLYFTGLSAASSYGPEFASPRLVRHLAAAHA